MFNRFSSSVTYAQGQMLSIADCNACQVPRSNVISNIMHAWICCSSQHNCPLALCSYIMDMSQAQNGAGMTYAEWEAKQAHVRLPRWLESLLHIPGCGPCLLILLSPILLVSHSCPSSQPLPNGVHSLCQSLSGRQSSKHSARQRHGFN